MAWADSPLYCCSTTVCRWQAKACWSQCRNSNTCDSMTIPGDVTASWTAWSGSFKCPVTVTSAITHAVLSPGNSGGGNWRSWMQSFCVPLSRRMYQSRIRAITPYRLHKKSLTQPLYATPTFTLCPVWTAGTEVRKLLLTILRHIWGEVGAKSSCGCEETNTLPCLGKSYDSQLTWQTMVTIKVTVKVHAVFSVYVVSSNKGLPRKLEQYLTDCVTCNRGMKNSVH